MEEIPQYKFGVQVSQEIGEQSVSKDEKLKRIQEENRKRQRDHRNSETYEQTLLRRAVEAQRQREKRSQESEEEAELRRQKNALAKRLNRSQEAEESVNYRRAVEAERQRQRRALRVMSETPEQKIQRKTAEAERQRLRRARESEEQKAERRKKGAEAIAMRRWSANVQSIDFLPSILKQEMEEFVSNTSSSIAPQIDYSDVNIIYERYIFGSAIQEENETIINFIDRLKHLSINCNYQNMTDDLIRDRIILGIRDDEMRKVFLTNKFLTLQEVISICESLEIVNSNESYHIKTEPDLEINESHSSIQSVSDDRELLPCKEESSSSPIYQEIIHAETIEITTSTDDEGGDMISDQEMDISFLNDVKTYQMLDVPKYSCNICDETFFEIKDLTLHIKECKKKNTIP